MVVLTRSVRTTLEGIAPLHHCTYPQPACIAGQRGARTAKVQREKSSNQPVCCRDPPKSISFHVDTLRYSRTIVAFSPRCTHEGWVLARPARIAFSPSLRLFPGIRLNPAGAQAKISRDSNWTTDSRIAPGIPQSRRPEFSLPFAPFWLPSFLRCAFGASVTPAHGAAASMILPLQGKTKGRRNRFGKRSWQLCFSQAGTYPPLTPYHISRRNPHTYCAEKCADIAQRARKTAL